MKAITQTVSDYGQILTQLLKPEEICEKVEDIDIERLYNKGFKTVFLDVDNTILPYEDRDASLGKVQWVDKVKSVGFNIYLISNNSSHRRIERIAQQTALEGLYFALKPFPFALKDFTDKRAIDMETSIIIGDQILTDIIMANWLKAYGILVNPLNIKHSYLKTIQREIELGILKKISPKDYSFKHQYPSHDKNL